MVAANEKVSQWLGMSKTLQNGIQIATVAHIAQTATFHQYESK